MPYELRGSKVVRSDTGAVVKDHKGDRRKALAHLRALKANVEEAVPVLGALLDGFADKPSPESWQGRFQPGDKVRVIEKGADIVGKVERPSSAKRDHVIVRPDGNLPHVEAHVSSVRLDSPAQHEQARKRIEREAVAQGPPQVGKPPGGAQAAPAAAAPGVRESLLGELLEAFSPGDHPRGLRGRFVRAGHILTRGGIARVVTGADENGISYRPIDGGTAGAVSRMSHDALKGWIVHDTRQRLNPAVVSREWQTALHVASRHGGPSTLPQYGGPHPTSGPRADHAALRDRLASLPVGSSHDGILRSAQGYHVGDKVHRTPSAAAGAARRRRAEESPAVSGAGDRHGGFTVGDRVTYREPSIVNGKVEGYGPPRTREVVGLQRNGYLRLREPTHGTTVDVHHSNARPAEQRAGARPHIDRHAEATSNAAEQTRGAEVRRRAAERRRHEAAAGRRYAERHAPGASAPQRRVSRALGVPVAHDDPFGVGALLEAFAPPNAGPLVAPKETPGQSAAVVKKQEAQLSQTIADFNAKHPRSAGGKFASKGGTAARAKGVRHSGTRARKASSSQGNTLTTGTTGALVRAVQRQLRIPADGKYGPQTKSAVERYQRQHGLQVDGVVGAQTLAALRGQNARRVTPGPISSRSARIVAPTRKRSSRSTPHRTLGGTVI